MCLFANDTTLFCTYKTLGAVQEINEKVEIVENANIKTIIKKDKSVSRSFPTFGRRNRPKLHFSFAC